MLIVLANATLAHYFQGGGHWAWFLQYPLGLKALGHRVFWFEVMPSAGDREADRIKVRNFFGRLAEYGLERDAALAITPNPPLKDLAQGEFYGKSADEVGEIARDADLLWNFWYALEEPWLREFRRRAFIDVDPGHMQVCVALGVIGLGDHHTYLTVGLNAGETDCEIPTLGRQWRPFRPFVHLPSWNVAPGPGPDAPFTSITQWTWEELHYQNRVLSLSKRAGYMPYATLPAIAQRKFELAVNIGPGDPAGDGALLARNGWSIVSPHEAAATPAAYREYIAGSRGEFVCPKPIHLQLNTGWFSDRSVAYLASGRPVVAEDSGFSRKIPSGNGLIAIRGLDEAVHAVAQIDADYARHSRAAREIAEACFDSRLCLSEMIAACER
ncbi:MAG TPA: hypothetical protein VJN94_14115 [Candidatus Binataceae bacterium]|nr:hypothetical protein [Candidatus Binataceae bacterium]